MANYVTLCHLAIILVINIVMAGQANAQINTPCNPSTISTLFTPCMGFLTGSSANGTSPTTECCGALKSLTSSGMDCLCLLVTASVPFKIPINRTLAISLPRACNMPGVPLQCKTSGSPLPAPGPASFGPSLSPALTPSLSPQGSSILPSPVTPSLSPQPETTNPLSPSANPDIPSATPGSGRSDLTPSSAGSSSYSLLLSVLVIGFSILKHY